MTISYFSAATETADRGFMCLYAFAHVCYSFRVSTQEEFRVGKQCLETPLTKKYASTISLRLRVLAEDV